MDGLSSMLCALVQVDSEQCQTWPLILWRNAHLSEYAFESPSSIHPSINLSIYIVKKWNIKRNSPKQKFRRLTFKGTVPEKKCIGYSEIAQHTPACDWETHMRTDIKILLLFFACERNFSMQVLCQINLIHF